MTVASVAIDLGSATGIIGLAALIAAGFFAYRYRATLDAAQAAAKAWKDERDAEASRRERLEERLEEAKRQISELEGRVDELSRRPDLTVLERLMSSHETRAQERSEQIVAVLHEIAESLRTRGPS